MRPSHTKGNIKHFQLTRWDGMIGRCSKHRKHRKKHLYYGKGIEIRMTKEEFYNWCERYKDLIENMYKNGEIPTVDRIDSNGHYEIQNIQIISLKENSARARKINISKPIWSQNLITNEVNLFLYGAGSKEFKDAGFCKTLAWHILHKKPGKHTNKNCTFIYARKEDTISDQ